MRSRLAPVAAAALAVGAGACGDDDDRDGGLRPPAPINVTAAVDSERVRVSPRSFGAGPIVIIVSNQSGAAQEVTFEAESGGLRRSTGPIAPRATGTLQADPSEGTYALATASPRIRPARIAVTEPRPSAQEAVDLP